VTFEREEHPRKQQWQSHRTEDGMQIDESDEQSENASDSIRDSREPDSKTILETSGQNPKQPTAKVSTVFRIVTSPSSPKSRLIEVQ
jgi:hypothetical protein